MNKEDFNVLAQVQDDFAKENICKGFCQYFQNGERTCLDNDQGVIPKACFRAQRQFMQAVNAVRQVR